MVQHLEPFLRQIFGLSHFKDALSSLGVIDMGLVFLG